MENQKANSDDILVSIVIPVKDGLPEFSRVIEKLCEQQIEENFEVLIIDSGSKDGSLLAVPKDDARFRIITIQPSEFGHGKTRNLGASIARGKYVAFLTHDAEPYDEYWLKHLIRPMEDDPDVAGVYGRHIAYENATPFTKWELETHFSGLKTWPVVEITDAREYSRNIGLQQVFHFYSDNSSSMRKSIWENHPYPEVDFAEDQIWAKEIIEAGYKKAYAWDSVVYHSHNYGVLERFRRSYDEARALNELFGYRLCGSLKDALRQTIRTSARDINLAFRNGWFVKYPVSSLIQPLDNLARQMGYYVGTERRSFFKNRDTLFSRDRALKARS